VSGVAVKLLLVLAQCEGLSGNGKAYSLKESESHVDNDSWARKEDRWRAGAARSPEENV
jgi:hypothetical protein